MTIFNVLYVVLKDDETTFWKFIIMSVIDFFQITNFPFYTASKFPWKADSLLSYIQTFLNVFQLVAWLAKLDLTTYIVVFYLCIVLVCLVILDIFYVSYSFQKKKFKFLWPLQALRYICGLFVTVLFLPLLETFTSILSCDMQPDGTYTHSMFPEFQCWRGPHILHATFALLVSSIFIIISTVVAFTYYDSSSLSNDPSARVNSRADVFILITKIILNYIFTFFGKPQYHWFCIISLLLLSSVNYFKYRYDWPFYNETTNKLF